MNFLETLLDVLNKYGISAALVVIVGFLIFFLWKLYNTQQKTQQKMNDSLLNIIERNNDSLNNLKTSIDINTKATEASVASMNSTKDVITSILVKAMQGKGNRKK